MKKESSERIVPTGDIRKCMNYTNVNTENRGLTAGQTCNSEGRTRMPKALCLTGMVIAIVVLLLFLLDLIVKFPFQRANVLMDIVFALCAALLGFISWTTFREPGPAALQFLDHSFWVLGGLWASSAADLG